MKAFITGGTGFIGSHLIELLREQGLEVFALVRDLNKKKWLNGLDIHFLEGDLFNLPALPSDLDCVFHLAALTKAIRKNDYYTVNHGGTASLFRALKSQRIFPRVVTLSTLAAGGPSREGVPRREVDPPRPVSDYGRSKLLGEFEALKHKDLFRVVVLRAGAVFGPRDKDFLDYFLFLKRGLLPSVGRRPPLVSLCYIKDFIRALDLSMKRDIESGEVFNVASPGGVDWDELGRTAAALLGRRVRKVRIPLPVVFAFALGTSLLNRLAGKAGALTLNKYKELRHVSWVADVRKARETLSFEARFSLEDALGETLEWYRTNRWI